DERRDHVHGRVWRVTAKGRPTLRTAIAENATIDELLNLLKASEDWTRLNAKLLLKQHGAEAVLPRLAAWLVSLDAADPNYEHQRLEALWLNECLDSPNAELLAELVKSADHRVRAAAIRTASHWRTRMKAPVVNEYFAAAVRDEHPRVRLEGVRALAEVPSAESAAQALVALDQPMDRFLDFALWQTMRDLQANWLPAVREGRLNFDGDVDRLTFALKAVDAPGVVPPLLALIRESKVTADRVPGILSVIAALGGANELGEVLNMVVDTGNQLSPEVKASLLDALVETTRLRQVTPAGDLARIGQLLKHDDERVQAAAARAAGAWKVESLRAAVSALAQASDATSNVRRAALDGIAAFGGPESVKSLLAVANSQADFSERQHAVNNLANIAPQAAAKRAVAMLRELPEGADPSPLLANLMARKDGPAALVKAFGESQDKLPADVAKLTVRAVQGSLRPSPELVEAVRAAGGLADAGWKLTPELSAQLVAEVAERGDAARGEAVFRSKSQQCLKCHAIGGAGGRVGPDLTSIGGSAQVDYLIESLIAPAAKVKENFHSKMVLDDNGRIFNGIPVRQAGGVLVLRDAEDREVSIPENQIDEIRDGRSLMPDGLVDPLTRDELVDLTRFLSELGKVGAYSISNTPVVRRWQVLTWTEEAHRRLNRTSFDTAATNDPALVWEPVYSRVFGDLPLDNLPTFQPHRQLAPTTFVRFELDVTTAGEVALQFGDASGLSLWVNGKPQPITSELRLTLDQAVHSFTLAVDQNERRQPLRAELLPGNAASAQFVTGK
ncbi:MAG: HEAT repeat domain-containing protein, partial [Planctomycetales bacterium]|nr:HEAT repeat domain-containing protein [Planctomycetales bacterium]